MDEQLQVFTLYDVLWIIILYCISHYFLADNYTKYIGWMLFDKVMRIIDV